MTRPVRPARCMQLLRAAHVSCNAEKFVSVSVTMIRVRQKSNTKIQQFHKLNENVRKKNNLLQFRFNNCERNARNSMSMAHHILHLVQL